MHYNGVEKDVIRIAYWIKENPKADPNLCEIMKINIDASQVFEDLSPRAVAALRYINDKGILGIPEKLMISRKDAVCKLYIKVAVKTLNGKIVTSSPNLREFLCKLGSICGYIAQQERDFQRSSYDNTNELMQLKNIVKKIDEENAPIPVEAYAIFNKIMSVFYSNLEKTENWQNSEIY